MTWNVNNNASSLSLNLKDENQHQTFFPINDFDRGSSLFWSIVLAYLFEVDVEENSKDIEGFYTTCVNPGKKINFSEQKNIISLIRQLQISQDLTFIYRSFIFQNIIFAFRQRVVNFMERNGEFFQSLIQGDLASYLQSMRLKARFASKYEIVAISSLLNCNIEVIDVRNDKISFYQPERYLLSENLIFSVFSYQLHNIRLYHDPDANYFYLGRKSTLQLADEPSFVDLTSKNDQLVSHSIFYLDVPKDDNCLFWSIALSYLLSLSNSEFSEGCKKLFGFYLNVKKIEYEITNLKNEILNLNKEGLITIQYPPIFNDLVKEAFRLRIVDYMDRYRDEFKPFVADDFSSYLKEMVSPSTWGDEPEIKAASDLLECCIKVFPNWQGQLKEPLSFGSGSPVLYLFYDELYDGLIKHYYFGITKADLNVVLTTGENSSGKASDSKQSQSLAIEKNSETNLITRSDMKHKRIDLISADSAEKVDAVFRMKKLSDFLLQGIEVGILGEIALLVLPASPIARFLFSSELPNFNYSDFVQSPYECYQEYQSFLLKDMLFDKLLKKFIDAKRPFNTGILVGAIAGLINAGPRVWNRQQQFFWDGQQFLLVLSIGLMLAPIRYEQAEILQFILRNLFAVVLSVRGLVKAIDATIPHLNEVLDGTKSFSGVVRQLAAPFSLFSRKKEGSNSENNEVKEIDSKATSISYS